MIKELGLSLEIPQKCPGMNKYGFDPEMPVMCMETPCPAGQFSLNSEQGLESSPLSWG